MDLPSHDQTIDLMERAIRKAKLGQTDELRALRRMERHFGDKQVREVILKYNLTLED